MRGRAFPTPINVASPDCAETFFAGSILRCADLHRAGSLPRLREVLRLLAHGQEGDGSYPATLDLIGHSTRGHRLLRLGDTVVDMLDPTVELFFTALRADRLLERLDVRAVRLIGCGTATTDAGRRTLRLLATALDLPVFGTTTNLLKSHSDAAGFDPAFDHVLVEASTLT